MSRSESSPTGRRALRRILWLAAGVLFGLLAGFVAALAASGSDTEPSRDAGSASKFGSQASGVGGGRR